MATLKLDVKETVPPVPTVTIQPVVVQPAVASVSDIFISRTPSDWHIEAVEDSDLITAVSNKTNEHFEGTMAEFNRRIKG